MIENDGVAPIVLGPHDSPILLGSLGIREPVEIVRIFGDANLLVPAVISADIWRAEVWRWPFQEDLNSGNPILEIDTFRYRC